MNFYIKGYYGYKNFWDEMLIFWLLNYIEKNIASWQDKYYYLEVQDPQRMQTRMQRNKELLDFPLEKIHYVPIQQNKYKRITHLKTFLGRSKYRKMIKFFGGGELFDAKKSFPHNGRNLLILYWYSVFSKNFYLVGGIGQADTIRQKLLQKILISRAKQVICRDKTSYQRVKKYVQRHTWKNTKSQDDNILLYHDFSFDVCPAWSQRQLSPSNKTILLNAPYSKSLEKYITPYRSKDTKLLFFPCEYTEDKKYFASLQQHFPQIQSYDWTQCSLIATLKIFAKARCGVGKRLHFCLPLHHYKVPYACVEKSDKQKKLLK